MHSQRCGTQKSMIHVFPERHLKGVMGAERGGRGGAWAAREVGPEKRWAELAQPGLMPTAYKEKMKELSVLSLICSCFYSQPHPNTVYQYGGECLALDLPLPAAT